MEDQSKLTFKQMLSALLRSNRRHARYIQAFACLAVLVAVAVPLVMRQYGVAMTTTETRLACQYAGNGAHTHNADCYDAYGNLVCPLPEKPFHTHTDSCYATERVLTCTLPETAGHAHTDACYDEDGNLTCTIPEEPAHTHADACYETRRTDQLVCGMEETTEEHVHGPACFETVTVELPDPEPEPEPTTTTPAEPEATVPSTPEEDPTPAQEFTDVLKKKDQDGNEYVYLVVQVKAPQGALPKGSTMSLAHVDLQKREVQDGPTIQDKLNEVLRKEAGDEAAFVQTDAVDITFKDAQGNRIDPAKKVEVRVTTSMIRTFSDQRTANDDAVVNNSLLVLHVVDKQHTKRNDAPDAELIRKAVLVNQDEKNTSTGHEDTILFEATEFSPYIVARVNNAALAPEPEPEPEPEAQPTEAAEPATEATLDLTTDDQPAEAEPERPAQSFTHRFTDTNGQVLMRVDVLAPEGAFPLGTTMQVKWVDVSHIEESVTQAVSERTDGKLRDMRAVDITFIDPDGHEIEPAKKITVTFASDLIDTQDDAYVVHVDDEGKSEVIDALGSKELEKREIADQADELVFESDAFSTYVVAVTTLHKELTASDGATYDITVDAPAEAGIPQDAELRVSEIMPGTVGYEDYLYQALQALGEDATADNTALARFFDIKIFSGEDEIQPQAPVKVSVKLADQTPKGATASAVHFEGDVEGTTEVLDASSEGDVTTFDATGFSVYGVIYTVDFHWDVDGQTYDFSIQGGDTLSLRELLVALGVVEDGDSEAFIAQVDDVMFSDTELVAVARVDEDTTAGDLKARLELQPEYSLELTEEDIAAMDAKELTAPDWALMTLKAFDTEETLTIVMVNGDIFTIRVTDAQIKKTVIDAKGATWEITVTYGEDAQIPEGAELKVKEILSEDEEYQKYYEQSLEKLSTGVNEESAEDTVEAQETSETDAIDDTVNDTSDSDLSTTGEKVKPAEEPESSPTPDYARIFDIEIWAEGKKVDPAADVLVGIKLSDTPEDAELVPHVVHFAEDKTELMQLRSQPENGEEGIQFVTDGFSVYSVIYTVDFSFNINGKQYSFSLEGGDSTSIKEIIDRFGILDKEKADLFINSIAEVKFSNPKYLWSGKLTEGAFAGELKQRNNLDVTYAANIQPGNILAMNVHHYSAPDWVLIALKPFTSEETLTITMKNGEAFTVKVTDAQEDAVHNSDGTVQTIANPAGTTFELFDYYVSSDTKTTAGRDQWPGHIHDDVQFWKFNWYDFNGNYAASWDDGWGKGDRWLSQHVLGAGNNSGINKDHVFKFTPANAGTVVDGTKGTKNADDPNAGLNSYTQDADPKPGIVQSTLSGGYPVLTTDPSLGTDGTSLAYLFDSSLHEGKDRYTGVDRLLYVDPDGYYTYDSRDFKAELQSDNTFILRDQTSTNTAARGFWPFGEQVYWAGLHMNTQFSMPANGQVLNPKGVYKDMVFEFSGDDDTWLYIDGVLVGDGGGIHNRTKISVNFATGDVVVTGKEDTYGHAGAYEWRSNLRSIFEAAGRSTADFADGTNTFKVGTYHTFDMFYLERGGGESNLYIHYNLVSTADFTGHKEYHGEEGNETLLRDQFRFDLIGLDGLYGADGNLVSGKENEHAIMPQRPSSTTTNPEEDGAGTVAKPLYIGNYSITVDNQSRNSQLYRVGVTEDGNVNFGMADIPEAVRNEIYEHKDDTSYTPPIYHYIVREWVPADAVNAQGKTWAQCTEAERKAGGFSKGDISYDGKIYYMAAQVTYWPVIDPSTGQPKVDGSGNTVYDFGLSKKYYMDEAYKEQFDENHRFINFDNRHVKPLTLNINKKGENNAALSGAAFKLSFAVQEKNDQGQPINKWSVVSGVDPRTGTTGADGKLQFANLTAGNYILEETSAPEGYKQATNKWLVQLERFDEETGTGDNLVRKSHLIPKITLLNLDGTVADGATPVTKDVVDHAFEHEVINEVKPPANITVEKKWLDENGNDLEEHPTQITFKVYQLQHEHVWGDWITDKQATEDEEGLRHRICSIDNERQDEVIPKAAHVHTLEEVPAKPATCTESGNIQYWKCTKDSLKFSDSEGQNQIDDVTIPALGHNYQVTAEQSATCTASGSKTWTCSRCHDSYSEPLDPLGHDWPEWASDGNGHETRTCSRCHLTETRDAQNLYPGTTIVLDDYVWPTNGGTVNQSGIFKYGDQYWVIVKNYGNLDSGNAANGPSGVEGWGLTVKLNGTIENNVNNLYPNGNNNTYARVQKGTLVLGSDGNYYVRTNSNDWSFPPKSTDTPDNGGWYKLPTTSTTATTLNSSRRMLAAARIAAAPEASLEPGGQRLTAQSVPTSNLTEQALLESLGLTAVGVKNETTGNKIVVYGTQTLPTPVGTDHLWSMDIEIEAEDEDGVAYKYYVIEDNPGAEYATSYAGQDNGVVDKGVVTITNQRQPQTTDITLFKVDADTIGDGKVIQYLAGATFYLNKGADRQHPTVISLAEGGGEVPVDDDGHFTIPTIAGVKIEGLTSGTYTLHEVSAPAGYIITGTGEWEFTVSVTGGTGSITESTNNVASGLTLTIPNPPGAELPEAGGPGTLLHTLCGLALFAAAGYVGLASKRSARKEVA